VPKNPNLAGVLKSRDWWLEVTSRMTSTKLPNNLRFRTAWLYVICINPVLQLLKLTNFGNGHLKRGAKFLLPSISLR
jgi:hypothetical protein